MWSEPKMSSAFELATPHLDESALGIAVKQLLEEALQRPVKVAGIQVEPSPFATLFPASVVTVTLDGSQQVALFLKCLGPEQSDHPEKGCRDREIRVYEQLLSAGSSLPVARYYGSRWDQT